MLLPWQQFVAILMLVELDGLKSSEAVRGGGRREKTSSTYDETEKHELPLGCATGSLSTIAAGQSSAVLKSCPNVLLCT